MSHPPPDNAPGRAASDALNRQCFCVTLDRNALDLALIDETGDPDFAVRLRASRPHLFSHAPIFLPKSDAAAMHAIVRSIEAIAERAEYRQAVSAWAPSIAAADLGPRGAFMGYDFHLGEDGPKLIEINTNAGGAFLNAFLARAQIACCPEVDRALVRTTIADFETGVMEMFKAEWRHQGRQGEISRIAIVDDAPEQQYLQPEFVLAQRLIQRHGVDAVIADAAELRYEAGAVRAAGQRIDLIYNRLVDFALADPAHAAMRAAYLDDAVVVTPNPRNHALFADKRNLTLLSDQEILRAWGVSAEERTALSGLPRAFLVTHKNAEISWSNRKRYFFKPASGYGGKAVYRGDKLTKGAWSSIVAGDYIAQEFAPPGERIILLDGEKALRKVDVRLFTYAGQDLLAAARLYQGQTTNFRTPGGGFAPVFFI